MTDYIKRDKRQRTFIEIADDLNDLVTELNDKIVESIREENADAVPVVRCKDCKWYVRSMIKQDGTLDERYKPDWCDLYRRVREETYFCADGERRRR